MDALSRNIRFGADLWSFIQLYRLLRRERPDIVHTHTAKAGLVGRLAAFLARVPIRVHTYHGHVLRGYFGPVKTALFCWIEKALAKTTDRLIMVSAHGREELLAMGIGAPERFLHIPLGLELSRLADLSALRGRFRAALGVPTDALLVGDIARLVPIKGLSDFIRAARLVHEKCPRPVHFAIVGVGELERRLRDLAAREGLSGRLHFAGFWPDVAPVYADIDLCVLSSYNEGLPVAVIESMAAGLPVVATRVGGLPELVDEGVTGYLCQPGDVAQLADRMLAVLSDPARARRMGAAGRARVVPHLCAERLVADMENLYTQLAREKGLWPGGAR
ncbi:glycosyltransferase family 4 protein [bacterium]|nr:glycosyltransferase family 4 protein [bacterium]